MYYNSAYLFQPATTYSWALKITRNIAEKMKENVKENKQSEQLIKKPPNSNKTTACLGTDLWVWMASAKAAWYLHIRAKMNERSKMSVHGWKEKIKLVKLVKLSPLRKQVKSEPGTGVRKRRGRNTEKKTKMIPSKNTAPTSLGWRASLEKLLLLMAEDDISLGRERKGKQKSLW